MKAVILAGGYGTRISEESDVRPKPMVELGNKPILWHIMKIYSNHGINDFIICCGYKGHMIKEYFTNYFLHHSDITLDMKNNSIKILKQDVEDWRITLVDTGEGTMTGGRIKRVQEYIGDEAFCMTYGDGVSDVNISSLIEFHKKQKALVTLTAVQQPGRFGAFSLVKGQTILNSFREKPKGDGDDNAWINGGFFVIEPEVINEIAGDETVWERDPLEKIALAGKLAAFKHDGFWFPMDTLHDKRTLENMWNNDEAPWKIW